MMRVLVVDDELDHVVALSEELEALGFEVETSLSGHEAVEVAARFRPDAVLMDVYLPDINGITLAGLLRAVTGDGLRIVALSGADPDKLRSAVERALFDDFLCKPAPVATIAKALAA